jgi:hypothetical protein
VIDRPRLEALNIHADTELELSTDGDVHALYAWVHGVAAGSVDKAEVVVFLRQNTRGR